MESPATGELAKLKSCRERLDEECCCCCFGQTNLSSSTGGSFFGLEEGGDVFVLSLQRTFAPRENMVIVLTKLIGTCVVVATFTAGFWVTRPYKYYFIFVTHWGLLLSVLYSMMSSINTVFPPKQPSTASELPSWWIRLTWFLFVTSAHLEITLTILYWWLDYSGGISVLNIMKHGGVLIIIVFQGLVLDRIPVRMVHFFWSFTIIALYIGWTYIHSVLDIGNPYKSDSDPETNDDVLYSILDWNKEPESAAIVVACVLFVLAPVVFSVLWIASLYSCFCTFDGSSRRYLPLSTDSATTNANVYEK